MERRAFLSLLAGSPLVFGLKELLAQDAAPDFVAQALKRMKETRKYGVFIVIPADKESREQIGQGLLDLLAHGELGAQAEVRLFCAHVFVCLTEAQAAGWRLGAKVEGEGVLRILVDSEGKRVHADRVKLGVFKDKVAFSGSFSEFIHGKERVRLRDQAKIIEESMTEEERKTATRNALPAVMDKIAPWLTYRSYFAEDGGSYLALLQLHYTQQLEKGSVLALPFGIKAEQVTGSDPCPPCGMGGPYKTYSFRFLSFYAK